MDNITHGLAGLLMADATVSMVARRRGTAALPRFRQTAVLLGIAAAELPDSDLLYSGPVVGMGPLGYLLHHRGHTHTLIWASIGAVLLWLVARWWLRRDRAVSSADVAVLSAPLLALAFAGTWSHLLLDWTNSYGVHPFWPFDTRWYYGDAVFIVEPWLWVMAIPPLLWGARSIGGRVVLSLMGLAILAASWFTGQVARDIALLLTLFTLAWMLLHRVFGERARIWSGLGAWVAITLLFFASAQRVRRDVTAAAERHGDEVQDVVLNPAPGDPSCWSALVIARVADGPMYRLTTGVVAPWRWRTPPACAARYGFAKPNGDVLAGLANAIPAPWPSDNAHVVWRATWATPVAALRQLAAARCEVAAAFRFMRAPVWMTEQEALVLADVRYGVRGGFNTVTLPSTPSRCSLDGKWIPPWTPPRALLLSPP